MCLAINLNIMIYTYLLKTDFKQVLVNYQYINRCQNLMPEIRHGALDTIMKWWAGIYVVLPLSIFVCPSVLPSMRPSFCVLVWTIILKRLKDLKLTWHTF